MKSPSRLGPATALLLAAVLLTGCSGTPAPEEPTTGENGSILRLPAKLHRNWASSYDGAGSAPLPRAQTTTVQGSPFTRVRLRSFSVFPCPEKVQAARLRMSDFAEKVGSDPARGVRGHVALLVFASPDEADAAARTFEDIGVTCDPVISRRSLVVAHRDVQGEYFDSTRVASWTRPGSREVVLRTDHRVQVDGPSLLVIDAVQQAGDLRTDRALERVANRLSLEASEVSVTLYHP